MKDKREIGSTSICQANIADLMAEYNRQINSTNRHAYSETTHNDDGGCCCCDLCECGCDLFACFSGI